MRSKNGLYSFRESRTIIYWLCEMARIPVPAVREIDAVGYYGEQNGLEIRLRKENDMGTIVHEWLHYVFTLVWLERIHWQEQEDEDDNIEHRVVLMPFNSLSRDHQAVHHARVHRGEVIPREGVESSTVIGSIITVAARDPERGS